MRDAIRVSIIRVSLFLSVVFDVSIVMDSGKAPDGWTTRRHPEGAIFYIHDKSVSIHLSLPPVKLE